MTAFTVPLGFPYPQASDPVAASEIQDLAEAIDDSMVTTYASAATVSKPPAAKVLGTTQSIVTGVGTRVVFNSVYFDNDNMADLVSDPSGIGVKTAGVYYVTGSATFAPNATGFRQIELNKNFAIISRFASAAVNSTLIGLSASVSALIVMAVGDRFQFAVGHTAGVSLSVSDLQLSAVRVSP